MSVISQVRGRHVINPAGDMICRESGAMKAVVVMSYSGNATEFLMPLNHIPKNG